MVFAPFSGVDNHNKCITFAAGLIVNEDITSYSWMFQNFKEPMGAEPRLLVTDQDPSMKSATRSIFSTTENIYCMWHIMCKAPERVGTTLSKCSAFRRKLDATVWNDEIEPDEFEEMWKSVIEEYQLKGNDWLKNIFSIREPWIPAYSKHIPLSRVGRTTSVVKSQNKFFKMYTDTFFSLVELLMHYDTAIDSQRHNQTLLNIADQTKSLDMVTDSAIEKYCASIFILHTFRKIQLELKGRCRVLNVAETEKKHLFTLRDISGTKCFEVEYHTSTQFTKCSCVLFMREGLPCCHVFLVLKDLGINKLNENLVLLRWTKEATLSPIFKIDDVVIQQCAQIDACKSLRSEILTKVHNCLSLIDQDEENLKKLNDWMDVYIESVKEVFNQVDQPLDKQKLMEDFVSMKVPDQVVVKDPVKASNKGSGIRLKRGKEKAMDKKKKTTKRMCKECNKLAFHDSRNCRKIQAEKQKMEEMKKAASNIS